MVIMVNEYEKKVREAYGIARIHERRSKVYIPDILESKWSLKGLEPIVQPDI